MALELLKNANISAGMVLPSCQDTGTAIVLGKKGQYVWTDGNDEESLSRGIYRTYTETNLRYSQMAPLSINGFGVREAVFAFFFRRFGLPIDAAVALSLVSTGLVMGLSLAGGYMFLRRRWA